MLKVLELFGGIGAPRKALKRLNIDFETVDYVEIDKYAVKSYNAIYNENYEPQDICDWDKDIDVDLIFHGSPCQDFSLAGKQAGGVEGSGTRSSLLWETIRIVKQTHPKYVIWENVKNLIGKKHKPIFDKYLEVLENLGYTNFYQVLNTKDFGIPQNRQRVFTVSIKNEQIFKFPKSIKSNLTLKDILQDNPNGKYILEVDEKYYLSDKMKLYIANTNEKWTGNNGKVLINKKIASTINTGEGSRRCDASNYIVKELPENFDLKETDIIIYDDYNSKIRNDQKNIGTLTTNIGVKARKNGYKILIKNATKKGYIEAEVGDGIDLAYPESKTRRGRVQKEKSNTITTSDNLGVILEDYTIRKLTPLECWRLQGFDDRSVFKASEVCSNTQLYKQAGNSITVNVLEHLFTKLFNLDKLEFLIQIYVANNNNENLDICRAIIKEIKPYTSKQRFLELINEYKNSENYKYLNEVI